METDWNAIVRDLGPRLFRYFRGRFSHEEASDLVQETLIRLVRKVEGGAFSPDKGNLRMFAFGIAHFVALENVKPKIVIPLEPNPSQDLDEILTHAKEVEIVRRSIESLPEVQREILLLMIDEEMTIANIAALLDIPAGTVKSHISRGKDNLRELMKKELL